jgi:hypothetical protein
MVGAWSLGRRGAMHKTVAASIILSLYKALTNHSTNDIADLIRKAAAG